MVWDRLLFRSGGRIPGPRDWSPGLEKGKEELKKCLAIVPPEFLVAIEDVRKANWPEVTALVEDGMAFILKIGETYHAVYVDPMGKIRMDPTVRAVFGP